MIEIVYIKRGKPGEADAFTVQAPLYPIKLIAHNVNVKDNGNVYIEVHYKDAT